MTQNGRMKAYQIFETTTRVILYCTIDEAFHNPIPELRDPISDWCEPNARYSHRQTNGVDTDGFKGFNIVLGQPGVPMFGK